MNKRQWAIVQYAFLALQSQLPDAMDTVQMVWDIENDGPEPSQDELDECIALLSDFVED